MEVEKFVRAEEQAEAQRHSSQGETFPATENRTMVHLNVSRSRFLQGDRGYVPSTSFEQENLDIRVLAQSRGQDAARST